MVSYHTDFKPYNDCSDKLERSLNAFGIPYEINVLPSEGDWHQNCCQKTTYVREMMDKHPDKDIVWCDADMEVVQYPVLLDNIQGDVACPLWEGIFVMSCLVYFKNTPRIRRFVDCWIEKSYDQAYHFVADQFGLSKALKCNRDVKFEGLPEWYSYIYGTERSRAITEPPVIISECVSRRISRTIPE